MTTDTRLGITYPEATDNANLWEHFQAMAEDVDRLLRARGRVGWSGAIDTDSSTFTTIETAIATVTAALISGKRYKIVLSTHIGTTNAGDTVDIGIRETNASGTELNRSVAEPIPSTTAAGHYFRLEAEFTATATGNKVFAGTAQRNTGTGTLRREAAAIRPTSMYVEYANVD